MKTIALDAFQAQQREALKTKPEPDTNGKAVAGGGRPSTGYRLADGSRVPGVTTIISRFKDSGGLIRWAHKCGLDGIDIDKVRDDAADTGSVIHDMVERDIHGVEWEPPRGMAQEEIEKAALAFKAYQDWARGSRVKVTATEVPLVSERHRFGGTLDAVGEVADVSTLLDWKSSNRIYADYLIQMAAYRELWRECRGEDLNGCHLLRFGKDHGTFTHLYLPPRVLDRAWRQFEIFREAYDIDKELKKAAGA